MTIYRGPGGTGSATSDADTTLYQDFLNQTIAARDAALQAEVNAELAETNAETAETNAETAATNAANSASSASSSASAAANSASNASSSASAAASSASSASTSATNSANSATAAASSATSAANSASTATTQASNASSSATAAASSASNAATSATNAASSASSASTSAINAANSATSASNSASSAATSATNAANSATSASNSASAAAASASEAAGYAASINPADLVHISGTETITGAKTFSTNPTLSAGTANGVAYLNGSKVLTTGSALTFDGTKLSLPTVLAIKGAQNSNLARIAMTRTDASYSINNETDLRFYGQTTDTESPANILHSMNIGGTFVWNNGSGSEQMRLTSTGLGIGTSSPSEKLTVAGNIRLNGNRAVIFQQDSGVAAGTLSFRNSSGTQKAAIGSYYNVADEGDLEFIGPTGGTNMLLSSSGNLGLGVTPSAWGSNFTALQIKGKSAVYWDADGNTSIGSNIYRNSSNASVYYGTGLASQYVVGYDGTHKWFTAPSGTAGNAITFTQAMTLDASGNLALGTTTAQSRLTVVDASSIHNGTIHLGSTSYYARISQDAVSDGGVIYNSFASAGSTHGHKFHINGTERARIDSSGNLLIGTTSNNNGYTVYANRASTNATSYALGNNNGGWTISTASNELSFSQFNVGERARIDSSGNLLVGTTSSSPFSGAGLAAGRVVVDVGNSATVNCIEASSGSTGYIPLVLGRQNSSTGNLAYFVYNNTNVGVISTNGTTTTYSTSSDYRLKEVIAPMSGALARVAALKPVTYKWKADGSDGEGFIAHELAEVCPQAVTGEKDAVDADGNPVYQGIDTSFLVATLTAAIQELKAEFDAYKASHP